MVNTDTDITLRPEALICMGCCGKGICNPQSCQCFRLFPHIYIICYNSRNPNPKPVFQGMHDLRQDSQFSPQILHIGTQALCIQRLEVIPQGLVPKIKIMVSKSDIVVSCRVKRRSHGMEWRFIRMFQDQGVFILFHLCGQVQDTACFRYTCQIIHWKYMSMGIRSIIYL